MKHLMIILLLSLLTGLNLPAWSAQAEQPSSWSREAVEKLKGWGRIEPSYFNDYQTVLTRKEFACLALTVFEALTEEPAEGISENLKQTFEDTEDYCVLQVWQRGISRGDGSSNFKPDAPITREQLASMIVKLAEKAGKPVQQGPRTLSAFQDASRISSWAETPMQICLSQGILSGTGNNRIEPQGEVTREQAYTIIVALMEMKSSLNP